MINYEFPPFGGGTGVACAELLRAISPGNDLSIDLVTSGPQPELERRRLSERIVVHRLPVAKRDPHYWRAGELASWTFAASGYAARLAAMGGYHICHCWAGWPSGMIGYRLRNRVPYVVSLRGSDVPGYNTRLRMLDPLLMRHMVRRVWRGAARVVAVSRELRELALRSQPEATIDVIPNGVDVDWFRPAVPGSRDLLFVGRLIERKGVDILIRAFGELAADHPLTRLIVVGDGPERSSLEALAATAAPSGRVLFTGHLTRAALAEAYASAGIFVLPALRDAMPNVVMEAMASGLAIVTTRTGAMDILDGNGLVAGQPAVEPVRDAIARYLQDADLLARHQRRSRELAEATSWSAVADYFRTVYQDVVAAPRGLVTLPPREFAPLAG